MSRTLIYKDEADGKLVIDENTLNDIQTIQGPLAVCLIVGPYRSGKSYLMNNLLLNNAKGHFAVGHKDTSETQGILVSERLFQVKSHTCPEEFNVLLMDTEGLESIKNEKWDSKLFLIGIIMSSVFLYNTKNALSSDALNKLSFITKIRENLKLSKESTSGAKDLDNECPDFFWVVRDFFLEKTKSPDESLQEFLRLESESDDEDESVKFKNNIRASFLKTFKTHSCCYMVEPELNENSNIRVSRKEFLRQLDTLSPSDLCQEFQRDLQELSEKILQKIRPKQVGDLLLDGPRYARFLRLAVDAVNSGEEFFMLDAITRVTVLEYFSKLQQTYREKLEYLVSRKDPPISLADFRESEEEIYDESLGIFKSLLTTKKLQEEFIPKFEAFREQERGPIEKTVIDQSNAFNKKCLNDFWDQFKGATCNPIQYSTIEHFEEDLKNLKEHFKAYAVPSDDLESIWNELSPSINQTRSAVIQEIEDKKMVARMAAAARAKRIEQEAEPNEEDQEEENESQEEDEDEEQAVPACVTRSTNTNDHEIPNLRLTSKGKPDFRSIEVKRYFGLVDPVTGAILNIDGSRDKRFTLSRQALGLIDKKAGIYLKSDGTPDMRYKVNKDAKVASNTPAKVVATPAMTFNNSFNQSARSCPASALTSVKPQCQVTIPANNSTISPKAVGPLKKDGTPDMRYKVNKEAYGLSTVSSQATNISTPVKREPVATVQPHVSITLNSPSITVCHVPAGPLKKDGTPDMRYTVNKVAYASSPVVQQVPTGPLKKDGTPDMRYSSNRVQSTGYSGYSGYTASASASASASSHFAPSGPLKKDGTPDMRYKANRR